MGDSTPAGMARTRRDLFRTIAALAGTGLAAAFAGCSSGPGGSTPTETQTEPSMTSSPTESPSPSPTPATAVTVSTHGVYGDILADAAGRTLYMFTRDSDGESACYDDCAEAWPPLTIESGMSLQGASGVGADVGTVERDDGRLQVTANGMPLYYFVNDEEPGDARGMGVVNAWFLLRPDGTVLKPTVSMADYETLGSILTDAAGRTLYMFEPDSPGESACTGDCAEAWPPLTVESEDTVYPAATITADLDTIEREDGSLQVTANDRPLYYFDNDDGPGDATGQGIGGVWFVLRPDGSVYRSQTPTPTPSPSPTPTPTPSPTPTASPTPTETATTSSDDDDGGGGSY